MQATARKPSTCSRCHAPGHNVTTCSQADPSQLVVAVTGFDPGTGIVNVLAYGGGTGPVRTYLPPRIDPRLYLGRSMPITVHSITQLAELYAAAREIGRAHV